jgi:hypothetical protein
MLAWDFLVLRRTGKRQESIIQWKFTQEQIAFILNQLDASKPKFSLASS